uniref:Reverse transcriptase zinc-binding domain-containing protein n=1 Tax=Oryza brachyantha TaxID=4533 RepID=J3LT89_ORYBR
MAIDRIVWFARRNLWLVERSARFHADFGGGWSVGVGTGGGTKRFFVFKEWISLMEILQTVKMPDCFRWKWESSGQYSMRSAYWPMFLFRTIFPASPMWKTLAPLNAEYFLWPVAPRHSWTTYWLGMHGISHPSCYVLCDRHEGTIDHILVFSLELCQLWWMALTTIGPPNCVLLNQQSFLDWLCDAQKKLPKCRWQEFNTTVTLGAWLIWKEHNKRIFETKQQTWRETAKAMAEEAMLSQLAKGVSLN